MYERSGVSMQNESFEKSAMRNNGGREIVSLNLK
jgi:hypothetical protein